MLETVAIDIPTLELPPIEIRPSLRNTQRLQNTLNRQNQFKQDSIHSIKQQHIDVNLQGISTVAANTTTAVSSSFGILAKIALGSLGVALVLGAILGPSLYFVLTAIDETTTSTTVTTTTGTTTTSTTSTSVTTSTATTTSTSTSTTTISTSTATTTTTVTTITTSTTTTTTTTTSTSTTSTTTTSTTISTTTTTTTSTSTTTTRTTTTTTSTTTTRTTTTTSVTTTTTTASTTTTTTAGSCFFGGDQVNLIDGGTRKIQNLKTGDRIWSLSIDGKSLVEDEIILQMHSGLDELTMFYTFETETGHKIHLTDTHNIPVYVTEINRIEFRRASKVILKNQLIMYGKIVAINKISLDIRRGFYSLLTLTSYLLVNNISTSVFSDSHRAKQNTLHRVFLPIRIYYRLMRWIYGQNYDPFKTEKKTSLHPIAIFLKQNDFPIRVIYYTPLYTSPFLIFVLLRIIFHKKS